MVDEKSDEKFLNAAIEQAQKSFDEGGIPIGAVLVCDGAIIGKGHNRRMQQGSAILHGEMDALENAGRLSAAVYRRSTMYTTLSPCPMCAGAIRLYGIPRVVIGESQTFMGDESILEDNGVQLVRHHNAACLSLMERFIQANPSAWNEDIGE